MVGVEADDRHFSWLREHLANNGFDPDAHRLLNGVIGTQDGDAFFPALDSEYDWGGAAVYTKIGDHGIDCRGREFHYVRKPAYSIKRALDGITTLDLVHVDIQGAEKDVIPSALDVLTQKVRWLVIGTHSRIIEGVLFDVLSRNGWKLENEKPCAFHISEVEPISEKHTRVDGAQVWQNPHLY